MKQYIQELLSVAKSQIGVREVGLSNTGVMVNQYLAAVGLGPGDPWCDAFVGWCSIQAAKAVGIPDPILRTGACEISREYARDHGILFTTPEAGDQFLEVSYPGGSPHAHHTGLVLSVAPSGTNFVTVEGNTNTVGSSEGWEVASLVRQCPPGQNQYRFIRWSLRIPEAPIVYGLYNAIGKKICTVLLVKNHALIPVSAWAAYLGFKLVYSNGSAYFNGQKVPVELSYMQGQNWAPLRDLVALAGMDANKVLTIKDPQNAIVLSK